MLWSLSTLHSEPVTISCRIGAVETSELAWRPRGFSEFSMTPPMSESSEDQDLLLYFGVERFASFGLTVEVFIVVVIAGLIVGVLFPMAAILFAPSVAIAAVPP